jgi:DNA-binding response OmpR family regulator
VQTKGAEPLVRTGVLEIDLAAHIVRRAGEEVALSPKEFELLATLAEKLGGKRCARSEKSWPLSSPFRRLAWR